MSTLGLAVVIALAAGGVYVAAFRGDEEDPQAIPTPRGQRVSKSNDAVGRACAMPKENVARLWRGWSPRRSFELILVPRYPNYPGSFDYTGHSGPWDYLQNIPLVLYGSAIHGRGIVKRPASIVDVYPTVGELLDANLPDHGGRPLSEAIDPQGPLPRLVVTLVWDGVGRNVLERWPDAWPNLKRLEKEGTSYLNASLASSPSITPATHTSLGTGAYPREHGIPGIEMRLDNGQMSGAFLDRDPSQVEVTTFADEYDLAMDNEPLVGMLGWKAWHLGMLSHGTQLAGGDADHLGLLGHFDGDITGNETYYSLPPYLSGFLGLDRHATELDREDGEVDGKWMGHEIGRLHDNPAWIHWQEDAVQEILEREGYGQDDVPDLFFTNYKIADIVGHEYTIESPEMEVVLRAQDEVLGRFVDYLDEEVGDYVLVITSDHGHTPPSSVTGGWPVDMGELNRDLHEHFGLDEEEEPITDKATAAGFFLDEPALRQRGITDEEITAFVNRYTIAENWPEEELPEGFVDRGDEQVFEAAFMGEQWPEVIQCAFGSKKLPEDAPL